MDNDKEGKSMDFIGVSEGKTKTKEDKVNTDDKSVVKDNKTGTGKKDSQTNSTRRGSTYNKNRSINKGSNINNNIESLKKYINLKFNKMFDKLILALGSGNINNTDITKEYMIIRSSIIKLRKSGRVKEAIDKIDEKLGVK